MTDGRIFPNVIDNSMRKELVKCETATKYRYEMGLRTAGGPGRVDLVAGGAYAKGLEVMRKAYYVADAPPEDALQEGIRACYDFYGPFIPPPKSNKTADRMAGALVHYAQENPLALDPLEPLVFPDGTYGIEVAFNHELGIDHPTTANPMSYCGRFDLLARHRETGDVWVVDDKTTSQMGEKWANQWPLDSQITGYCWGANLLLHKMGLNDRVRGAIINGMAIRLRDYEFQKFHAYREDWFIDRWFKQMEADLRRWKSAHKFDHYDMALDHACAYYNNPCEYSPLCTSRNPERIIQTSFEVKRWNPLTREET